MIVLFILYLVTYPIGFYTVQICLAAQLCAIIRKCGYPKMSIEYIQPIVFLDEFSNITYLMSISLSPKSFFIHTPLMISAALILSIEFKKMLTKNPATPVISMPFVKSWVEKGSNQAMQEYGRFVRADLEIYVGFFITGLIFFGQSNFVNVFLFWQMMRMRYMMNQQTQMAFSRLDQKMVLYLHHPYCPAFVRASYAKVKGLLTGLVDQ